MTPRPARGPAATNGPRDVDASRGSSQAGTPATYVVTTCQRSGQGVHGAATAQVLSAVHSVGVLYASPPVPLLSQTSAL